MRNEEFVEHHIELEEHAAPHRPKPVEVSAEKVAELHNAYRELGISQAVMGGESSYGRVPSFRDVRCVKYGRCLDKAAKEGWSGFSCALCPNRAGKVLSPDSRPTDGLPEGVRGKWEAALRLGPFCERCGRHAEISDGDMKAAEISEQEGVSIEQARHFLRVTAQGAKHRQPKHVSTLRLLDFVEHGPKGEPFRSWCPTCLKQRGTRFSSSMCACGQKKSHQAMTCLDCRKNGRVMIRCPVCEKAIWKRRSEAARSKYCSNACRNGSLKGRAAIATADTRMG